MTEADLNMTEVRVTLPEKDAGELVARISDMSLAARANISVMPIEDEAPKLPDDPTFTETFEGKDGCVELITQKCLQSFAVYEAHGVGHDISYAVRLATQTYNALARNLGEDYAQKDELPKRGYIYFFTVGFRADKMPEIVEKLKDKTIDIYNVGDKSIGFLERFANAYQEFRETQVEAVESKLVDLGTTALSTQGHELHMRFSSDEEN